MAPQFCDLEKHAAAIRRRTIQCIGELGIGHIGGSLSLCELLSVLYFDVMKIDPQNPALECRDRFVLSKGHGGPAVYAALAERGYFPISMLSTLNAPDTHLPSHCDRLRTPGIDMSTGSLGQGFSCAVGMAIAAAMDKKNSYIYAVIGDGESQEGQIWEAAMLAGHRKLDHLIAFTDYNKMQLDGRIDEINGIEPLSQKWEAFNWHVQTVQGHDVQEIWTAIERAKKVKRHPSMIILNTIKGKGAYFCEDELKSHNMPVTEEMWKKALALLEKEDGA